MDNRFKFRIYDKANEYMEYNDLGVYCSLQSGIQNCYDDCVLMACTGKPDKNSKLIYEGDIVKHKSGEKYEIKYHKKALCMTADIMETVSRFQNLWNLVSEDIEIIGNIYEQAD